MDINCLASSSKGNAYIISDGITSLLLEAGIPFKQLQIKSNFGLSKINGCLVTHEHGDHSKAVNELIKHGMNVYMTMGTAFVLGVNHSYKINTISPLTQFTIGTFEILPFDTKHDAAEPVGYLIYSTETGEKLLFVTDSFYCRYIFVGITHIMVECNYALDIINENGLDMAQKKRLLHSHFELRNVKKFLKACDLSKVKEIYLIHLSNGNSDEIRFKREIQALTGKEVYIANE